MWAMWSAAVDEHLRWLPAALLRPVRRVQVCGLVRWGRYEVGLIRHKDNINNERTTR